jgi:hypothetical protein
MTLTKEFLESETLIDSLETIGKLDSYEYDAIRHRFTNKLLIERTLYTLRNCARPRKPPLTYDDELQALTRLLVERLEEVMASDERQKHASAMEILVGHFGLTKDEAERVWRKGHGMLEFEEGSCRKCQGTGKVEVFGRSGCFGQESWDETCMVCNGKKIDSKRIKVPSEEAT